MLLELIDRYDMSLRDHLKEKYKSTLLLEIVIIGAWRVHEK